MTWPYEAEVDVEASEVSGEFAEFVLAALPYERQPSLREEIVEQRRQAEEWEREFRELVEAYHARWDDDFYMGEVARLHSPAVGVTAYYFACEGCDFGGYEGNPPDWPCRTAEILINRMENEPL